MILIKVEIDHNLLMVNYSVNNTLHNLQSKNNNNNNTSCLLICVKPSSNSTGESFI